MIKINRFEEFGHQAHGWLDAHHHFSFADYYDENKMGFGVLRVVNDDTIEAHTGFGKHAHHDMEIITYVRKGAITHEDSLGNIGRTAAGDVQVMSAGTGIQHAERNEENESTQLFQIWILPSQKGVTPRWDAKQFPREYAVDKLTLLVSGREVDQIHKPLFIHQDAAIYGAKIRAGDVIEHHLANPAYLIISTGQAELNGQLINTRDAAEITKETHINIQAKTDTELLLIELPTF